LGREDRVVFNWYLENCTGLAKDFNLMPMLLERLGLDDEGLGRFLLRINLIHGAFLRIQQIESEKETSRRK